MAKTMDSFTASHCRGLERDSDLSGALTGVSLRSSSTSSGWNPPKRDNTPFNNCKTTVQEDVDDEDDDEDMHFAHPHRLLKLTMRAEDRAKCKVCGLRLVGSARGCRSCSFYIHGSCFDLPRLIAHDAHPSHNLDLALPKSGSSNKCDGCRAIAHAGFYRCKPCDYDLDVTCAVLYKTVRMNGNSYKLYYTSPVKGSVSCHVCSSKIPNDRWMYYNKDFRYAAHVKCVGSNITPDRVKTRLDEIGVDN